jgi:hypothetical protein
MPMTVTENKYSGLGEHSPRSSAYSYFVHSRFPGGASVFEYDKLDEALDALCDRGRVAKDTGLTNAAILYDGNVIAEWVRLEMGGANV